MAKTAIIVSSDQHIGSTVALCPPRVPLDDGGWYYQSPGQRWLWRGWLDFISWARELAQGYKTIAVFNGDLAELDCKRRTNQLVNPNKSTILSMIADTLEPLTTWADSLYFIRGTPAHTGKSGWIEDVAADYTNTVYKTEKIKSHYQVRLDADGVRIDIAHHASMGGMRRTAKNAANQLAHDTMNDYAFELHAPLPHIVVRSHNHRWADSWDNFDTRAVCIPCWSLPTEYIMRMGKYNGTADVGGVVVLCDSGKYEIHKYKLEPMKGRVWMQA